MIEYIYYIIPTTLTILMVIGAYKFYQLNQKIHKIN